MIPLTKPEFWLSALGFVLIMSFALLLFGNSLQNSDSHELDDDSNEYLTNYTALLNNSGFTSQAEEQLEEPENPLIKFITGIPGITEILGVVSLFANVLSSLWNFLVLAFNLPSFFISSLGLPIGSFKFAINILGTILFLGLTILLVRLSK